jgi:hypothetical protein
MENSMAQLNPDGTLALEQEDVLPREVAVKTDDPPHIVAEIQKINPTIKTAEDLVKASLYIDDMRKEFHHVSNPDVSAEYQKLERTQR